MIDEQKYRALIQQLATGGITGNKTYHQYHDQYVPMDSESMMYANGGGVGSMMKPRQNYRLAGFIEDESETFTPNNFGLQLNNNNVDNNQVATRTDQDINTITGMRGYEVQDPNELYNNMKDFLSPNFTIEDMQEIQKTGKDTKPTARLSNDKFLANNNLYADSGMFANDLIWGGNDTGVIYQGDTNEAPVLNDFNRGPITYDQNTGKVPPGYEDGIMRMAPARGRFSDFDQARMGAPVNTSLGYEDPIMNREENYTTFDDSFQEIPGYNFIDAPTSFSSRLKNREFLNNPRRGIIDNQILGKGSQGEFGALNKVKDFFGNTKDKIGNVGKKFKEGTAKVFSPLTGLASMRDPLNPKSQNYNSNLASQLNFADSMGMITDDNKFSEKMMLNGEVITNPLRGQNAISGFGSNDLIAQLEKTLGKQTKTYNKLSDIKKLNYKNKFLNNTQTLLDQAIATQTKERNDRIAAEKNAAAAAAASNRRKIESYTGRPMSDYRSSRPSSERNYTGSGKSGMGRSADRFAAAGGIVSLKR